LTPVHYIYGTLKRVLNYIATSHPFLFLLGLLLVCQKIYCNEISTPSPARNDDIDELLTTLSMADSQNSTTLNDNVDTQTRTSITRLHPVTISNKNATTSVDDDSVRTTTPQFDDTVCGDADDHNYLIESIAGDVVVSLILHQSDNATAIIKFIVNRINEIDLLAHNISIGEFQFSFSFFVLIFFYFLMPLLSIEIKFN
jgi:hypothetical protein